MPSYPGQEDFGGVQLHSSRYRRPDAFAGQRVLVVGGGNSGAQIMAEVPPVAEATWVTRETPAFLPEDVDGRHLFEQATRRYKARQEGRDPSPAYTLGDIVMVPPTTVAISSRCAPSNDSRVAVSFGPTGHTKQSMP